MGLTINVAKEETSQEILRLLKHEGTKLYGVKIKKAESDPEARVQYMYDAVGMTPARMNYNTGAFDYGDWKDVWFVKENYPVMLKSDGTVDYKLSPTNHAYKEDGTTASDVANEAYDGNAMSRIPLVWVCFDQDLNYEYITVSNVKVDDNFHAYAHTSETDGTTVLDEIFLAMYQGSEVTVDGVTKLRSLSNHWPIWKNTAQQECTKAKANGNGWYTRNWAQRNLINALLLIMSKTDDSQTAFGRGVDSTYVDDESQHYGMAISGGLDAAGQFMGYNDGTHQVKVFYMEDWWANQWERIAGLINDYGTIKVKMVGPYNFDGAGYDVIEGVTLQGTSGGYIAQNHTTNRSGRLPFSTVAKDGTPGASNKYTPDQFMCLKYSRFYLAVGHSAQYNRAGYMAFNAFMEAHGTNWSVGASLSFKGIKTRLPRYFPGNRVKCFSYLFPAILLAILANRPDLDFCALFSHSLTLFVAGALYFRRSFASIVLLIFSTVISFLYRGSFASRAHTRTAVSYSCARFAFLSNLTIVLSVMRPSYTAM